MEEKTLFPREEKSEILFKKISEDKWACEKRGQIQDLSEQGTAKFN